MKTSGYIFMFLAWGAIIGLVYYCFYKIFKTRNNDSKS